MSYLKVICIILAIAAGLVHYCVPISAADGKAVFNKAKIFEDITRGLSNKSIGEPCNYWENYPCNVTYFWNLPDDFGTEYYAMRFTPSDDICTLKTIDIFLYENYLEFSNSSGSGIDVTIFYDDGNGLPGTVVDTIRVYGNDLQFYPYAVSLDVQSMNLVFEEDYHIAFSVVDVVFDNIAILSDDGSCGHNRSSSSWDQLWTAFWIEWGMDVNFIIYPETCCGPRPAYMCGDANSDQAVNMGDAGFIIDYIFFEGSSPNPLNAGDANDDGMVNLGDAGYVINYIFYDGSPPCEPAGQ